MSEETQNTTSSADLVTLLTFVVANQVYGLPVTNVVRIIEMVTVTHLPDVPDTIQGIINLQGKAVPVMDIRRRFGLSHKPYGLHTPIILASLDKERMLGLIVDTVEDVLEVLMKNTETAAGIIPSELSMDQKNAPLAGVAKVNRQMVLVLNIQGLLTPHEHGELAKALGLDTPTNGRFDKTYQSKDGRNHTQKKS
jgi:purine-binding chemotaxis protein CheW